MKAALDITALGAAENPHQRGTIGIFRVVEHSARALLEAPDAEALFYAGQNRAAARRYFQKHFLPLAAPGRASFLAPALPGMAGEAVTQAEDFLSKHYVHAPWRWLKSGRSLWWGARRLLGKPEAAAIRGLDVYHAPIGEFPAWTRRAPNLARVMTVHDLAPLIRPELFVADTARRLRRALEGATHEDWMLCVSESTRRDLLKYYPACDPEKTLVTHLGAEDYFHPEPDLGKVGAAGQRYGLPAGKPYFLSVSTLEPRKNFETVIRAFADFLRADPASEARLALVGGVGWGTESISAAIDAQSVPGLRERIVFTGFVAEEDLAALYSGALAFIYMSFYEGFGLPVLEAMQCATPVVCSNVSSLPEVAGEAGLPLAPADQAGLAEAMGRVARDADLRGRLSAAGQARARQFSWGRYHASVLAAYRRAAARIAERGRAKLDEAAPP